MKVQVMPRQISMFLSKGPVSCELRHRNERERYDSNPSAEAKQSARLSQVVVREASRLGVCRHDLPQVTLVPTRTIPPAVRPARTPALSSGRNCRTRLDG